MQRLEVKDSMKCAEMCNWVQIEGKEMRLGGTLRTHFGGLKPRTEVCISV